MRNKNFLSGEENGTRTREDSKFQVAKGYHFFLPQLTDRHWRSLLTICGRNIAIINP